MKPAGIPSGFRRTASSLCKPASGAARRARYGTLMYSVVLRFSANTVPAVVAGLMEVGPGPRMPVDIFPEIDIPVDF
jgi:hypothetical protein